MTTPGDLGALDELAAALAVRSRLSFGTARTDAERDVALGLRRAAVAEKRWDGGTGTPTTTPSTARAVHVVGWREGEPICCGRLVLPPGPLPTEVACGFVIEPAGRVVDVGRMVVVPGARDHGSAVFLALLAALYLETQGARVHHGLRDDGAERARPRPPARRPARRARS